MSLSPSVFQSEKQKAFLAGSTFLFLYWLFGFDGITFSDDVYYLLAGKNFWEGTMAVNSYHFSTRWGAYVPVGFVGKLLGFEPHRISLISIVSYLATLVLLLKILPKNVNPWVFLIWFCSQVYFLHFLTKVYPDSLLVFWTVIVPFSAVYRDKMPFWSAVGVISGLFFGFLTKETIVFLAPLPLLLFAWDWKKGNLNPRFYGFLFAVGILFGGIYLGYFWFQFGSPFYRFESIQDGHYISEFTYADKSIWVMLKRLTILPILTFVERSYWLWVVFAVPGLVKTWKNPKSPGLEFGLSFLSLLVCFWFMSTNFRFYNPLYLNPRHLTILIPTLAFLIALGWKEGTENPKLKRILAGMILLGAGLSSLQEDWKMAGFQILVPIILYWTKGKIQTWVLGIYLLIPAVLAISYQKELKQYESMLNTLNEAVSDPDNQSPILSNNFLDFSKEVLLYDYPEGKKLLIPIEKIDSIRSNPPRKIRAMLYDYYKHAYPKEQVDVDALELWLKENYKLESEQIEGKVWLRNFTRN